MALKPYEILNVEKWNEYKKFIAEYGMTQRFSGSHKHHIIPECLGGDDSNENLIYLKLEDHKQAHLLLAECFENDTDGYIHNIRAARILGATNLPSTMSGENNPFFGKTHSEDFNRRLAQLNIERLKGKTYDEIYTEEKAIEEKKKRSDGAIRYYENQTPEEKQKKTKAISDAIMLIDPKIRSERARNAALANNPGIEVDGKWFKTVKDACEYFGKTFWFLKKEHNIKKVK